MSKPIKRLLRRAFPEPPGWRFARVGRCATCPRTERLFFVRRLPKPALGIKYRSTPAINVTQWPNGVGAYCVACIRKWRENAQRLAGMYGGASVYRWYASRPQ